jgi:hypothetical protein
MLIAARAPQPRIMHSAKKLIARTWITTIAGACKFSLNTAPICSQPER